MIKIAVVGPESSGKTSLCIELSHYFNQEFIKEYAREYINKLKRPYKYDDLARIASEQFHRVNSKADFGSSQFLITDTEVLTIKVWSKIKYGKCDKLLDDLFLKQEFDLYLLCNTDVEWKYDPLREAPELGVREEIFLMFEEELKLKSFRYGIVSGKKHERMSSAIKHIEEYIKLSIGQ